MDLRRKRRPNHPEWFIRKKELSYQNRRRPVAVFLGDGPDCHMKYFYCTNPRHSNRTNCCDTERGRFSKNLFDVAEKTGCKIMRPERKPFDSREEKQCRLKTFSQKYAVIDLTWYYGDMKRISREMSKISSRKEKEDFLIERLSIPIERMKRLAERRNKDGYELLVFTTFAVSHEDSLKVWRVLRRGLRPELKGDVRFTYTCSDFWQEGGRWTRNVSRKINGCNLRILNGDDSI